MFFEIQCFLQKSNKSWKFQKNAMFSENSMFFENMYNFMFKILYFLSFPESFWKFNVFEIFNVFQESLWISMFFQNLMFSKFYCFCIIKYFFQCFSMFFDVFRSFSMFFEVFRCFSKFFDVFRSFSMFFEVFRCFSKCNVLPRIFFWNF